jgi:hypothetical protein
MLRVCPTRARCPSPNPGPLLQRCLSGPSSFASQLLKKLQNMDTKGKHWRGEPEGATSLAGSLNLFAVVSGCY